MTTSPGVLTPGSVEADPRCMTTTGVYASLRGYLPPAPLKPAAADVLSSDISSPGVLTPGSVEARDHAGSKPVSRRSPGVLTPGSVEARDVTCARLSTHSGVSGGTYPRLR